MKEADNLSQISSHGDLWILGCSSNVIGGVGAPDGPSGPVAKLEKWKCRFLGAPDGPSGPFVKLDKSKCRFLGAPDGLSEPLAKL